MVLFRVNVLFLKKQCVVSKMLCIPNKHDHSAHYINKRIPLLSFFLLPSIMENPSISLAGWLEICITWQLDQFMTSKLVRKGQ